MFDWFGSCGMCSNVPSSGDYAFETYTKVPIVGGAAGNLPSSPSILGPRGANTSLNPAQFSNNLPAMSLVAKDSIFDEVTEDNSRGVVKKVLKSNYPELLKKHGKSGEKFTDPYFPPTQGSIGKMEDLKSMMKSHLASHPVMVKTFGELIRLIATGVSDANYVEL